MQSVFVQDGMRRRRGKGVNSHFQVMIFGVGGGGGGSGSDGSRRVPCAPPRMPFASERERGSLPGAMN